jgi:hypothetical protein
MTRTPEDPESASTIDRSTIPFDFSKLATFDPDTVPVRRQPIAGLVSAPPGQHPLEETLGEPCGDPRCPYRAHALELHPDPLSLLRNYVSAAEVAGVPFALVLEDLTRDVYRVRSSTPFLVADLAGHSINWQIPVTFRHLRSEPSSSLAWEITRIIRDHYGSGALVLPPARHLGRDLVVHAEEARELQITHMGSLQQVIPILSSAALNDNLMTRVLKRVLALGERPDKDADIEPTIH